MNTPIFLTTAVYLGTAAFISPLISQGRQAAATAKSNQIKKSNITVYNLHDKSAKVIYTADQLIEAPNWAPDGKVLLVNTKGDLWKLPVDSAKPELEKIDLGSITRCNNDKGFSPDGKLIAFSSGATGHGSQVYVAPASGGTPKMIVQETPSYFHGFSPDGKWLAVVAQRDKNFDIFRVPTEGGPQERLTSNAGYDDGAEYSPDGKWIYFNLDRSGSWDIWRIPAGGAGKNDEAAQQVTNDQDEDWFPKGTSGHNDHLNVKLRMIPLPGKKIKHGSIQTLTEFFGGQGTINVNSWAPDSSKFAFVSYEQ